MSLEVENNPHLPSTPPRTRHPFKAEGRHNLPHRQPTQPLSPSPQYSASELQTLQSTPGVQFKDDWAFKHNLLILPEKQRYQIIQDIRNSLHIGPKALYRFLNPLFHPHHLLSTIQEVQSSCTVCAKTNSQGSCHPRCQLHQLCGFLPGQDWQIDFTHMPKHKQYRYLLTIVDTFSGWTEAYPTASESAGTVATHLIQDIIPRFGLPATIQSDNGPAFISKVTNAISTSRNSVEATRRLPSSVLCSYSGAFKN
ncbi:uncharacterized protein LOC144577818 [Callithrix jacchus]